MDEVERVSRLSATDRGQLLYAAIEERDRARARLAQLRAAQAVALLRELYPLACRVEFEVSPDEAAKVYLVGGAREGEELPMVAHGEVAPEDYLTAALQAGYPFDHADYYGDRCKLAWTP
jgi:hypothetical protein